MGTINLRNSPMPERIYLSYDDGEINPATFNGVKIIFRSVDGSLQTISEYRNGDVNGREVNYDTEEKITSDRFWIVRANRVSVFARWAMEGEQIEYGSLMRMNR